MEVFMSDYQKAIEKRRTFAIISHPDAGKTTLTEKLLLYGGAILSAGSVKGKKTNKHAVSDWMEIEKQRGISVTSSVMQFQYEDCCINILDTPGHQDFSEDTYRTLMAADSAVMVIDASKGVETQTKKLFKVCLLRHIPVFTFINKMDRAARDPFELLEHIESELGIATYAMNWPIGSGKDFKGVYERDHERVLAFQGGDHGQREVDSTHGSLDDPQIRGLLGDDFHAQLCEEIELLDGASTEYDQEAVSCGALSPVFFGSALTNFGVEPFLEHFLKMTTPPLSRNSSAGEISPFDEAFTAFIFKIQANMNKAHRDRIAFMRIVSGRFEKGMEAVSYTHLLPAYYSFLLGGYLKEMHQSGLSTKVCFQHLSSHQHSDVLQKIASCISSNLEAGIELLNALQHPLIDHQLIMYLSIGSAAGNLEELLDDYMFLQETRWLFWMKRITACITLSAYSFVGIAAVCIYRMMLIPLELLNTF